MSPNPDESSDAFHGEHTSTTSAVAEANWLPPPSVLEPLRVIAFRAAVRILRNRDDAEDAAQAALAALLARPDAPDNPEAWVRTTAKNLALNEIRRRKNLVKKLDRLSGQRVPSSEDFADRVAARLLLDEVLAELSPRQREALERRFRDDLSSVTVMEAMRIGRETLKTHLERGRASAKALLEEIDNEGRDE